MRYHDEEQMRDRDDFICKSGKRRTSIQAPHQVVKLDGHQYHMPDPSCSSHSLSYQKLHVCSSLTLCFHRPITSFLQTPLSRQRAGLVSDQRFGKDLAHSSSPITCPPYPDLHQPKPSYGAPVGESRQVCVVCVSV